MFERIRRVRQTGGPFSAEFRILTEADQVRWVLCRGSLERDETGAMRGRGAYIDTTDAHCSPFIPAAAFSQDVEDPLTVAADRCLEAYTALEHGKHMDLLRLSEALLFEIGRRLAQWV